MRRVNRQRRRAALPTVPAGTTRLTDLRDASFIYPAHTADGKMIVAVATGAFDAPGGWGVFLNDVIGHVVNGYAREGMDPTATRAVIHEIFDAERKNPTDKATLIAEHDQPPSGVTPEELEDVLAATILAGLDFGAAEGDDVAPREAAWNAALDKLEAMFPGAHISRALHARLKPLVDAASE